MFKRLGEGWVGREISRNSGAWIASEQYFGVTGCSLKCLESARFCDQLLIEFEQALPVAVFFIAGRGVPKWNWPRGRLATYCCEQNILDRFSVLVGLEFSVCGRTNLHEAVCFEHYQVWIWDRAGPNLARTLPLGQVEKCLFAASVDAGSILSVGRPFWGRSPNSTHQFKPTNGSGRHKLGSVLPWLVPCERWLGLWERGSFQRLKRKKSS